MRKAVAMNHPDNFLQWERVCMAPAELKLASLNARAVQGGDTFAWHKHPFIEWGLVLEGECRWLFDSHSYDLTAGEMILVPQGAVHREAIAAGKNARLSWIGFTSGADGADRGCGMGSAADAERTGGMTNADDATYGYSETGADATASAGSVIRRNGTGHRNDGGILDGRRALAAVSVLDGLPTQVRADRAHTQMPDAKEHIARSSDSVGVGAFSAAGIDGDAGIDGNVGTDCVARGAGDAAGGAGDAGNITDTVNVTDRDACAKAGALAAAGHGAQREELPPCKLSLGRWGDEIRRLFLAIYDEQSQAEFGSEARIRLCLAELLLLSTRAMLAQRQDAGVAVAKPCADGDIPLRQVQLAHAASRFFDNNTEQGVRIDEVARYFRLTPQYFSTLFRRVHGVSPAQYLQGARVRHACRLLAGSQLSVKEIASRCGYADSAHFCRQFKTHTGYPPAQYRLRGRAGGNQ